MLSCTAQQYLDPAPIPPLHIKMKHKLKKNQLQYIQGWQKNNISGKVPKNNIKFPLWD